MYGLATGDTIHWDSLCSLKTMYMSIHTATVVKRGCWQIYSSISSQSMMFGSTIQKMRVPFCQLKRGQAKIYMMTIETFVRRSFLLLNLISCGRVLAMKYICRLV